MLMPYDKVYSDGIRADPEASDMTTRSDGQLDVVPCPTTCCYYGNICNPSDVIVMKFWHFFKWTARFYNAVMFPKDAD